MGATPSHLDIPQAQVREAVSLMSRDRTGNQESTRPRDDETLTLTRRITAQVLEVHRELKLIATHIEAATTQCSRLRDNSALEQDQHMPRHALHLQARLDALVLQVQDALQTLDRLQTQLPPNPFRPG